MHWSLEKLYSSFESEKFKDDIKKLTNILAKLKKWEATNNKDNIKLAEEFIESLQKYYNIYTKLKAYSRLTISVDASNEQGLKIVEKLENMVTELTKPRVKFQLWLQDLPNRETMYNNSEILAEHRFFMEELVEKAEYLLPTGEETIIAKMKQTGSSAWSKLQEKSTSTLMVPIKMEGTEKELPLPVVQNMAYRQDAKLRKKGYKAELAAYNKIEEGIAAALNGIKGEVLTLTGKRGYKSPLEKTLFDSRMDHKTLSALLDSIKERLPIFHKFYRKKAKLLGHSDGLPFYDLFAPLGEKEMKFSYKEAQNFIIENIRPFSKQMADFYTTAFAENWIDAKPRNGKRGGAFCYNIPPINESRILSNFTGVFSDVTTLAHELGHAYHGYCLQNESILNTDYPMPLAETASIFSETVVIEAALKKADPDQSITILENKISHDLAVIVDIYSRFLFEKRLFAERKEASLNVDELKEMMVAAQKKAYANSLNHKLLHPYMWLNKPHYYSADYNYYNFPYTFGLLFGLGVYSLRKEKGAKFMDEYNNLLKSTGKNKIVDVAKMIGIDVHSCKFWKDSLQIVENNIKKFFELTK